MNEQPFDLGEPQLNEAWHAVEQSLLDAGLAKPAPGFSRRWLRLQQLAQARQEKRRALLLACANAMVTLGLLALIWPSLQPYFSEPGTLVAAVVNAAIDLAATFVILINAAGSAVSAIPTFGWLAIGSSSMGLILIAALILNRLNILQGEIE